MEEGMKKSLLIFVILLICLTNNTAEIFYQDNSFTICSDKDKVYYSVCATDYCDNSSGYTSSIMYQGTAPLWKISTTEIDTTIYCYPDLDGDIQTLHTEGDDYWIRINSHWLCVGDDESNQHTD